MALQMQMQRFPLGTYNIRASLHYPAHLLEFLQLPQQEVSVFWQLLRIWTYLMTSSHPFLSMLSEAVESAPCRLIIVINGTHHHN